MYDFSGIWYHIIIWGVMTIVALLFLVTERSKTKLKNRKSRKNEIMIGLLMSIVFLLYYIYILINPSIEVFVGEYYKEHRERGLQTCYCFKEYDGSNNSFYLDLFSAKRIIPAGFVEGIDYDIYYEVNTKTIVKVEYISMNK